ncbi:hypothetical protein FB567DRAFT_517914 [Paraphoma chrysanthemicola]|uniref:Uncharacterized protein n=1 Tax=Paraphoma chrysanthemicola TaxID=798071 RepID=A0A8K0W100_9PLEO|nr:hypothetical protein FB567DRAFT_517914 [Paraphoma chrysanthemicola]
MVSKPTLSARKLLTSQPSNLPNLRRLFVEARSDAEESAYSRNAVRDPQSMSPHAALAHSSIIVL